MKESRRYLEAARRATNPTLKQRNQERYRQERAKEIIRACRECELYQSRKRAVPFNGDPRRAKIVLVGEAPGAEEDTRGVPFVGRSGDLLDKALLSAGSSRDEVMVVNTICCRPPKNRDPLPHEVAACRPNFDRQMALTPSWVVVPMGRHATFQMVGWDAQSLGSMRGKLYYRDGRVVIPTWHPAYALRQGEGVTKELIDDLQLALAIRMGSGPTINPPPDNLGNGSITAHFKKKGWAYVYSERIGDQIVIVDAEKDVKVPPALENLTVYTTEELQRLGELAKATQMTVEELRRLHMVKSEFGGTVIYG